MWEQRQNAESQKASKSFWANTSSELALIINRAYAHELTFTEEFQKQKRKLFAVKRLSSCATFSVPSDLVREQSERAGTHCVGSERHWSLADICRRSRWRCRPCRSRWRGMFLGYDKGLDGKDLHGRRRRKMGHYSKGAPLLLCLM